MNLALPPLLALWHTPEGATTVWSGSGDIQIANCQSKALCTAGNVENARKIGLTPALAAALYANLQAIEAHYGGEPSPGDVFHEAYHRSADLLARYDGLQVSG